MAQRTWKIRSQLPNGEWGPEREVTLAQYLVEHEAACQRAKAKFHADRFLMAEDLYR